MSLARGMAWLAVLCATTSAHGPWERHTIDASARGADGVRLADANGDGRIDIVTGWEEAGLIRVYLHPGPSWVRQPWPMVTAGRVAAPEDAVFVDLDADGSMDVVSSCEGTTRTMFVHWGPRDKQRILDPEAWQTEPISATAGREMWMFAVPLQVDGRNGADLLIGSKGARASISWLEAPADPRNLAQWRMHRLRDAGWIMSLAPRDVDGDGDLDTIASDRKGKGRGVFWLEHPGHAAAREGAAWKEHAIGAAGREVMFLDVTVSTGGGGLEVIVATKPRQILSFTREGDGRSWAEREWSWTADFGTAKAVRALNLFGEGKRQWVFSCEAASGRLSGIGCVTWPGQAGEGGVPIDLSGAAGEKFDLLEALDMDGDGDLDVVTTEESERLGVVWYENR